MKQQVSGIEAELAAGRSLYLVLGSPGPIRSPHGYWSGP
jgi:hypothetical protein